MAGEGMSDRASGDRITAGGYRLVTLWAVAVVLVYAAIAFFGARTLRRYKAEIQEYRQTWFRAATTDAQPAVPKLETTAGKAPVDVTVGVCVNRIEDLSLDKATWLADFDVWFRWTGDRVSPGEHFRIPNGDIEFRERLEARAEGNDHYELFNVRARLSFKMDPGRFPFNEQVLSIQIEDEASGAADLRYLPDDRDTAVNSLGIPSSMKIVRNFTTVKAQVYQSRRGDPRLRQSGADVHSRFIFAAVIGPAGAALFLKLFQALFASVAISLIVFFIKPTQVDPRFGLGVGAFFAAVSNNIYVRAFLPYSDRLVFTDMINSVGLLTIFLTMVQSTVSLYLLDTLGREKLRRLFDHVCFAAFLVGFVLAGAALILAARS